MVNNILDGTKNILIIGYGISGKSVTSFLLSKGHNVYIYDDNNNLDIPNRVNKINWNEIDFVVKSPSIHIMPHNRHPMIDKAMLNSKPIYSTFDIFVMYNPSAKVIGITGTNGKSTTASLVYHILKNAGVSAVLGGNIGIPYFNIINKIDNGGFYFVFEMSSYELTSSKLLNFRSANSFKFTVGGLINIQPDHLDFHGSFENYVKAKHKILDCSKCKVISCDDNFTVNKYSGQPNVITISSSSNTPANYKVDNNLLIANNQPVLDVSNLPNLIGNHNIQNLMFAYAICSHLGISNEKITNSIATFTPLPHRMNVVRKIRNVLFVNDSKATNPMSSAPALATYTGYKIFWLVGGRSKHVNPMPYINKYIDNIEKIYLFGESVDEFKNIFINIKPIKVCRTMEVALHCAYHDAKKGMGATVVLLSPMCASFDQFTSFEHRGNTFISLVNAL